MPENIYSCWSFQSVRSTIIFNLLCYIEFYMSAHIHLQEEGMKIKAVSAMSDWGLQPLSSTLKIFQKKINTYPIGQSAMYIEVLFQGSPSTLRFSDFICIQGIVATLRLSRTKLTNPRKPPQSTIQSQQVPNWRPVGKAPCPVPWAEGS